MRFALAPALVLVLTSLVAPLAGCASAHDGSEAAVGQSEEELALASLYGTWQGPGPFYSITFTTDLASTLGGMHGHRFETTFDTGIRCVTTPCPSSAESGGVYKLAHGTQLTLAHPDKPSPQFARVLGEYSVKLNGKKLTLTKREDSTTQTLEKVALHTAAQVLAAAEAYAWPTREKGYVYRVFDTRAAAEAWGSTQSNARWLAHDGETVTTASFVIGTNDLWAQEFTVDKATLKITITGEH